MARDLQHDFLLIRDRLALAIGPEKAWTIDRLAEAIEAPRRTVEMVLEERLADFPFPLVADSAGYYQPTDADQLNHYRQSLRSRAFKIFRRAKAVARCARRAGWPLSGRTFLNPPARQGELNLTTETTTPERT